MTDPLVCRKCGASVVSTNLVFTKDGGIEHIVCVPAGDVIPCGFCHAPVRPTASRRTVDGVVYHAGCWDRKARTGSQ